MKHNDTGTPFADTLAQLCLSASLKYRDRPAFAMLSEGAISGRVTYKQMGQRSRQIGSLLNELGVKRDAAARVLLLSENSPEWALSYFGIAFAGAVSVPLLTGFSADQIQNIANHSEVSAVCVSRSMALKFIQIGSMPEFVNVPFIYIDSMTIEENLNMQITVCINNNEQKMRIPLDTPPLSAKKDVNYSGDRNDLASIIYTSGTQGSSKGVMLSNSNLISSAFSSLSYGKIYPRDRLLSVLPLAHSYECSLGLIAPVASGACVTYLDKPPSPSILLPALKTLRPTIIISVPLLIEKIYNNAIAPKLNSSKLYKCQLTRPLAVKIAGRKLLFALGGRIRFFGIGGAPLSSEVEKFLYRAKFPYTVGYGLTEAAPLVAGNAPFRFRINKGLKPPKGVKIRIDQCRKSERFAGSPEDGVGEIQVQGPNVMMGYYKDKIKTAEVFTSDGWLRTGDLGKIDKKGKLHIRGRLKALILGPSGENIYPEEIEGLLGSSALIEDALVYSGEKGELVALVSLSETAKAVTVAAEQVLEDLRSWVNKKLAVFSHLNRIVVKKEPFEKTPTMKIKRYLYI